MKDEQFDLVLTGLQSDDQGFAQTGVVLAERLGLPHATIIMEVQVDGGALRVKRELEGGWFQWVAMPLPARADHSERHQPASLRHAQGHHGGEEEGDPQGRRRPSGLGRAAEDRQPLRAREGQEDADDSAARRPKPRRSWCAGCARKRGSMRMILVVAEQRDGKLNRATWETIAAAQQLAQADRRSPIARAWCRAPGCRRSPRELAAAQVQEVVDRRACRARAVHAGRLHGGAAGGDRPARSRRIVLLPHTYQTRDFAPKLAARLDRALVTDVTGVKSGGGDDARSCGRCSRAS